jgi:polyphosphate kinase
LDTKAARKDHPELWCYSRTYLHPQDLEISEAAQDLPNVDRAQLAQSRFQLQTRRANTRAFFSVKLLNQEVLQTIVELEILLLDPYAKFRLVLDMKAVGRQQLL